MNSSFALTDLINYDIKNIRFSAPIKDTAAEGFSYQRVNIKTIGKNGELTDLIVPTAGKLFSFGVKEYLDSKTGKPNSWSLSLSLHNRDGATKDEEKWVENFSKIITACQDYVLANKSKLELYDLEKGDLKKLNPLYYKKIKVTDKDGNITLKNEEGKGPSLYPKLIYSKKKEAFVTQMYDMDTYEAINPLDLQGNFCYVKAAIKMESIFVGSKVSFQYKVYESAVEKVQSGMPRLLPRAPTVSKVFQRTEEEASVPSLCENDSESDNEGSLNGEESSPVKDDSTPVKDDSTPPPVEVKKKVRNVVKKTTTTRKAP